MSLNVSAQPAICKTPTAAISLRLVVAGHVDHGKSTLIGRLLADTGSIADSRIESAKSAAQRRGQEFEPAFLLDALQIERNQGITVDTTEIHLRLANHQVTIIDVPGHHEFLRNMITGAASADAGLILVDAEAGLGAMTLKHAEMFSLLGIENLVVAINKMDLVGYSQQRYLALKGELEQLASKLALNLKAVVPVAARIGHNIVKPAAELSWYGGSTLLEAALGLSKIDGQLAEKPLRLSIQDVYRFNERRVTAGQLLCGKISVGDRVMLSPSGTHAKIAWIETARSGKCDAASAGDAIALGFDKPIFAERGQIICYPHEAPSIINKVKARIFWLQATPLVLGQTVSLRLATQEVPARITSLKLDDTTLSEISANMVAEAELDLDKPLACDTLANNTSMARFALCLNGAIFGGGNIIETLSAVRSTTAQNITPPEQALNYNQRKLRQHHRAGVIWLTGLSGAGKSSIAAIVEKQLFEQGWQTYLLDGDALRTGLNSDLGFSQADRQENIRRAGEVAALFASAGIVTLCAFISPFAADRQLAQAACHRAVGAGAFHEIYVNAQLASCEERDIKGLYKKARNGLISDFTGISSPYEPPANPSLIIHTDDESLNESAARLMDYIIKNLSH